MTPALDHVGVVTRDLAALAKTYNGLGFTLTPLARHPDGRIGNRCAMLRHAYIELLAVVDPKASSTTLARFLARYAGIHIIAFAIDDTDAAMTRLRRAEIAASLSEFKRGTDDTDPNSPNARFALIQLPDQPEGRINLVRHLTPEVLWQERYTRHQNNACDLVELSLAVVEPADTTARFSRLVGCAAVPDPAGGFALELAHGRVRILPVDAETVPCVRSATLRTSDENAAINQLVRDRRIPHNIDDGALVIGSTAAGGVVLRFAPGLGCVPP